MGSPLFLLIFVKKVKMDTTKFIVNSPHGNIFKITFSGNSITVGEIKRQIQKEYGYDAKFMKLKMRNQESKDSDKFDNCNDDTQKITSNDIQMKNPEFLVDCLLFENMQEFLNNLNTRGEDYKEFKSKYDGSCGSNTHRYDDDD